jgi:hypothetical protein
MKLISSKNLQYVAMGVIGILVILWVYRHFMKDGFQDAPSSVGAAQQAIASQGVSTLCATLQGTLKLLEMQIANTTDSTAVANLTAQIQVISTQAKNACNPADAAAAAAAAPAAPAAGTS